ncbi:MAG TPA: ArsR family transcriptional regulator [Ghiorsea sp.]|nr:ArsR family transcriptional regulator [Ghiorsea sp.]HIP07928.1 ArsR family transcriptional regulator [Mariprofundaceae bacterium]
MSNIRNESIIMASQFKALANPVRLKLFEELTRCCKVGEVCDMQRCVGELAQVVDIAASTLSHHLKTLHQAGLIEMQRAGKNMMCRVDMKVLEALSDYFKKLPNKEII